MRSFLSAAGARSRTEAARCLAAVLERRRGDPNLSSDELAAMAKIVERRGRS